MSTGTGTNVSKGNIYGVLAPPVGSNVSKALIYAVLAPVALYNQFSSKPTFGEPEAPFVKAQTAPQFLLIVKRRTVVQVSG